MRNSTYLLRKFICLSLMILLINENASAQQIAKSLTASNGVFIGFYEYKPTDYSTNPSSKYPVIIFLHGIGERGNGTSELPRVKANAIPKFIDKGHKMKFFWNGKWQTFLVLSPQLSSSYGSWQKFYVEEMIAYAKTKLNADTNRIFLTGLSLGGGGVWSYASASIGNASQLAAIAPVCGTCSMSKPAHIANADLPVWAFHASNDGTVSVNCTHKAIDNINSFNPAVKPIKTIYPDGNHGIWNRAYDTAYKWHEPNIFEWFLGQDKSLPVNILPIAKAGTDTKITLAEAATTLNGKNSKDADGTIVKYIWKQLNGPTQATINKRISDVTDVSGLSTLGKYDFELTVIDNRTAISRDTVSIIVEEGGLPPNKIPVAEAGANISMTLPVNMTVLDGSGSTDADGSIQSYKWSKISGPSIFEISTPLLAISPLNNLIEGVYAFELQVTDDQGDSSRDTIFVTVHPEPVKPNIPPTANAGIDVEITLPTNSTSLFGNNSVDTDGTIEAYQWTKIQGPTAFNIISPESMATDIENLEIGSYLFLLQVTDDKGSIGTDTVRVTVLPAAEIPNELPIADAGADISIILPANTTSVDGSNSNDPDGSISSFLWTKISGPASYKIVTPNEEKSEIENLEEGTYSFQLQITDNEGAINFDTLIVVVHPAPVIPNKAPVAIAGSSLTITLPENTITVSGDASYDDDGEIIAYNWYRISGPSSFSIVSSDEISTVIKNLVAGSYRFGLKVTDDKGEISRDTLHVVVNPEPPKPNQPPVANAGEDITITLPVNTTTLDGSGSTDSDGTIASYKWTKLSGPSAYNLANSTAVSSKLGNLAKGTYLFSLVVIDDKGASSKDTVRILVNPEPVKPNVAPVADAGDNTEITLPINSVMLNGSASNDPDGSIVQYKWSKLSGPLAYNLENPDAVTSKLSNLSAGTYQFTLEVTDDKSAMAKDTLKIVVHPEPVKPNLAPIANAGADMVMALPVNSTLLDGTASSDSDGSIVSYKWEKISGPSAYSISNPASVSTNLLNLTQGVYLITLKVTDDDGAFSMDTIKITVNPAPVIPNKAPAANAGSDIVITLPTNTTVLNGSLSKDIDGSIVSYKWSHVDGPASFQLLAPASSICNINGLVEGSYVFSLTVTDNQGAISKDSVRIVVNPAPNKAPIANAGQDKTITLPVNTLTLNGSASQDPDGKLIAFQWSRISGPANYTLANAKAMTTTLSGLIQGTYIFTLQVTDDRGAIAKDSIRIVVLPAPVIPNKAPVANAGTDIQVELPTNLVSLNGTASYDPDGSISAYSWTRISGPGSSTLVNSTTKTPSVIGLQEGIYVFRLTVTDNKLATASDDVTVTVRTRLNKAPVAHAGKDTTIAIPATTALLNGSASFDPDGEIKAYSWKQINGPNSVIFTEMNASLIQVSGLIPGSYDFELTVKDDLNGFSKDSVRITVVDNFRYEENLRVSPNPAKSTVKITILSDSMGIVLGKVYSSTGMPVLTFGGEKEASLYQQHIDVSRLSPGLYFLELRIGSRKQMLTRIFKQ